MSLVKDKLFQTIYGNEGVKERLKNMLSSASSGQCLLFAGPDGIGKSLFAIEVAKFFVGTDSEHHPDIHLLRPTGKTAMHAIESIRALSYQVHLPPNQSQFKVFIVYHAEKMLTFSANALLKTFEEPPSDTVIILLTSSPNQLLGTVLSRAKKVYFQPIEKEKIASYLIEQKGVDQQKALEIAFHARGSIDQALFYLDQESPCDPLMEALLQGSFKSYFEMQDFIEKIVSQIEKLRSLVVEENNHLLTDNDLTALTKEAIQKEIEAKAAYVAHREMEKLLQKIVLWQRDLHLLNNNGDGKNLYFQSYRDQLLKQKDKKAFSLEEVIQIVDHALLSLSRSTPIKNVLMATFLKLKLI